MSFRLPRTKLRALVSCVRTLGEAGGLYRRWKLDARRISALKMSLGVFVGFGIFVNEAVNVRKAFVPKECQRILGYAFEVKLG